jgi:hypothetical protein
MKASRSMLDSTFKPSASRAGSGMGSSTSRSTFVQGPHNTETSSPAVVTLGAPAAARRPQGRPELEEHPGLLIEAEDRQLLLTGSENGPQHLHPAGSMPRFQQERPRMGPSHQRPSPFPRGVRGASACSASFPGGLARPKTPTRKRPPESAHPKAPTRKRPPESARRRSSRSTLAGPCPAPSAAKG